MPRPRVLISAYACGPENGPEAGAGWEFATAAARSHDVHVITRRRFAPSIQAELARDPELRAHLTVEFLELSERVLRLKRRAWDVYWYYLLWQRALGRRARELHTRQPFDLLHHVTFANDWMPCGLVAVPDVPLVWGPVGGASRVPLRRVGRWLGLRGLLVELVRPALTAPLRRRYGDRAARRATLVVAQNEGVAQRFAFADQVVVEPNAAITLPEDLVVGERTRATEDAAPVALFVGRLLGWKGPRLVLTAFARPQLRDWRLRIYGEGRDRDSLVRLSERLGLTDRVEFLGHASRDEVFRAYTESDVFVFPSMHDQAGWVVAEASSVGVPVVCLPLGGPPILARPNDHVAALEGDLVGNVVEAVLAARRAGGVRHDRWSPARLPGLVEDWYAAAIRLT